VLYHLLALCPPFPGDEETVLANTVAGRVVSPDQRVDGVAVPRGLADVVMQALQRSPEDRYESVQALGNEVRRYLKGYAPDAEHAGLARQLWLLIARNKRFSITVSAAIVALVVGTTISFRALAERERLALQAQQQAEGNLRLYLSGLVEIDALSDKLVTNLLEIAIQHQFQRKPNVARSLLSSALEQSPQHPRLRNALAEHELISLRFDSAVQLYESLPAELRQTESYEFARTARAIKPQDTELLGVDSFVGLLRELARGETWPGRSSLATRLVLYDQPMRTAKSERAQIIHALFEVLNPRWVDGWFVYDEATDALKVGGPGLQRISNNSSVLHGLALRELDISHSNVRSISREIGSTIEVLRIHDTAVMQRFVMERLAYLKQLYVSESQLSLLHRANLPAGLEVVVVP
jgi:hypothetical protein